MTKETAKVPNPEAKDWRKSDAEWQKMKEDATKGSTALEELAKIKAALGLDAGESPNVDALEKLKASLKIETDKTDKDKKVDVIAELQAKIEAMQTETAIAKWEKDHPAVTGPAYQESWPKILKEKGHLVKSGDLTYDDLWAIIRKDSKPSTSNKDFKDQELNLGSVPVPSKTTANPTDIDPDVYAVMKRAGISDEQIRLSA